MVAQLVIAVAEDNERGLIGRPNIEDRLAEVPRRLAAQMDLMDEIILERAAIAAQQEADHSQGTDEVDGVHPLHQSARASETREEPQFQPALPSSHLNRPTSEASTTLPNLTSADLPDRQTFQQPPSHPLADITGSTLNITSATTSRLNVPPANVQEISIGFRPFVVVDNSGPIVENGEYGVDEVGEVEILDELIVGRIAGRVEAPRAPQARPAPPPSSSSPAVSASSPLPSFSQVSLAFFSV